MCVYIVHIYISCCLCSFQINDVALSDSRFLATASEDGGVRIWSLENREQTLQFQVRDQVCVYIYVYVCM